MPRIRPRASEPERRSSTGRAAGDGRRARGPLDRQLARATGMSKSGLYAHFGSKLELQLATIEAARETFVAEVLRPALVAPKGIERLLAVCEAFLSHVERRVFPGGCFFSAAAVDIGTRPGPVRDAIAAQQLEWLAVLERLAREAVELGEARAERRSCPGRLRASSAARRGQHFVHSPRRCGCLRARACRNSRAAAGRRAGRHLSGPYGFAPAALWAS